MLGSAITLAVLWSALRLELFMVMTGEEGLWKDFGGWLFLAFVFFTWAALYHGIKYFEFLQREQEVAVQAESAQRQEALKRMKAEAQTKAAQLQLAISSTPIFCSTPQLTQRADHGSAQ